MNQRIPTRPHAEIEVGAADGVTERNAHVAEPFRTIVNAAGVPLSAVGSRMLLETLLKPTPLRVCLRHRPEITGTVLPGAVPYDPDCVRVRWDDTEQETHCLVANLAVADADDVDTGDRR